ncbi:MAG TPA: hypothetical protein VGM67_02310, partial [Gemmatimonadaceae bacterium]
RRADVPPDLARIIMTLLEKDPANRFPSAQSVVIACDSGKMPTPQRTSAANVTPPTGGALAARGASTFVNGQGGEAYTPMGPTPEEYRRWNAEPVVKFRRKLAPYLFVNGVIVIASIVGDSDFFGITVLWSIWMAFKYAKLWADGYDWRDVFRQPRDRDLIDVVDDFLIYIRSSFNRGERKAMREQRRARLRSRQTNALPAVDAGRLAAGSAGEDVLRAAGTYGERVRRAEADRDEILRLLDRMPSSERGRIPDVSRSADALAEKVKYLAVALSDLERTAETGGANALEAEISSLENAANPLDERGSDDRVRRLAYLKRQRRAMADVSQRRDAVAAKLETCVVALQNIKLDLIRLNAGSQTPQHVTTLAMDALNLADSVDSALYVSDEMRNTGTRPASRQAAR